MDIMYSSQLTFIDLFAGIGGFRTALQELGAKCVFSSELDPECVETYFENYGEKPHGDITKIAPNDIPPHDILCAGFPCQPFSICGKQLGFNDIRGTLFFHIWEIIKEKHPSVVFLENVQHLKNHDKGRTLKVIIDKLEELGYNTSWQILNAKDFGIAQNRERIIIIANKDHLFDFSKITTAQEQISIASILDHAGNFEILPQENYTILDKRLWKHQPSGLIFCGYRNKGIRKAGVRPNTEHLSRVHKQPNRIYSIHGTHPTIPSQETSGRFWIYDDNIVRKLTIDECYKIQGFPVQFKKNKKLSACYNQIGNSVAIPMINAVAKEIWRQIYGIQI